MFDDEWLKTDSDFELKIFCDKKRRQAETLRSLCIQLSILHTNPLSYKHQLRSSYLLITDSTLASPLTITISKLYIYCFTICLILLQNYLLHRNMLWRLLDQHSPGLSLVILVLHKTSFHNNKPIPEIFAIAHSKM
jgi:hypothetical protein